MVAWRSQTDHSLTLGVVAAALTDLDDRLAGRLRNLAITLVCFLLLPPRWSCCSLALAVCAWVNRIDHRIYFARRSGQRYATIAFGALLIAIYTMLGVTLYDRWYLQPCFLLTGAVWYNLLTLCGHLIFPIRPCRITLRAAMNSWRIIWSSNPVCLTRILRMRARRRCMIWPLPMVNW
jgi:uncharacterized membrane protein YccC